MSQDADEVSLSDGEIVMWVEQASSIHIKAITSYGDPVELSVEEAKELASQLLRLVAEIE